MIRAVFDIGGTNLRVALAENGVLGKVEKRPTPQYPLEAANLVRDLLIAQGGRADELFGGVAGSVQDGVITGAANLPAWNGFDFGAALRAACGIASVRLFNDADIAGYGEAVAGAGKEYRKVAFITVSTGIGGSLIIDKRIMGGASGLEPGKQIIDEEKSLTLENIASGAALAREFGKHPNDLPREVFEERSHALAAGFYNVVRLWVPDVLIVGGAMMNEVNGYSLETVVKDISALPLELPPLPPIVPSARGDDAGLIGAALFKD